MQGSGEVTQGTHDMGADMNGKQNNKQEPPPPRTPAQSALPMAGEEMAPPPTPAQSALLMAREEPAPPRTAAQSALPMSGEEMAPLHTVSHSSQSYPAAHCSPSMSEGVSRLNTSHGYRQQPLPITSSRMLGSHALFEEDFDETILRRKGQLQTMIRYVHNNPMHRWQKQRHPDRLVPIRGIMIAGRMYDAIGNLTLLGMARHQVWVRSRWDKTYRRNYQNECIVKARLFHTLVSPFISPHEAAVRDAALHEGHSIIVLADNGFSDYTQCPGGLYDYCVKGQVLVIVPSELPHICTKKSISRQECVMLNERAAEIANER